MVEAPKTYSKRWDGGDRIDPPYVGTEREILVAYLDWHRATFEAKCTGVPPERLSERTVPPSTLTCTGWSAISRVPSGGGSGFSSPVRMSHSCTIPTTIRTRTSTGSTVTCPRLSRCGGMMPTFP